MNFTYEPLAGRLVIEDEALAELPFDISGHLGPEVLRSLNKDQRADLLGDGNSEHQIGGRDTDVTQLAGSVARLVREHYPINEVPPDLALQVTALRTLAAFTEYALFRILDALAEDVKRR